MPAATSSQSRARDSPACDPAKRKREGTGRWWEAAGRGAAVCWRGREAWRAAGPLRAGAARLSYSESLLSELDPLELLLPDSEELLLLSRDGPPEAAGPDRSAGDRAGEGPASVKAPVAVSTRDLRWPTRFPGISRCALKRRDARGRVPSRV